MCRKCRTRRAEKPSESVVKLCARCAREVCPGSDVDAYRALVDKYGWEV